MTGSDFRVRRGYSINQWIDPGLAVDYGNTGYNIFYNDAARFFCFTPEEIDRHHGR